MSTIIIVWRYLVLFCSIPESLFVDASFSCITSTYSGHSPQCAIRHSHRHSHPIHIPIPIHIHIPRPRGFSPWHVKIRLQHNTTQHNASVGHDDGDGLTYIPTSIHKHVHDKQRRPYHHPPALSTFPPPLMLLATLQCLL